MDYVNLKFTHVVLVYVSVIFFNIRFWLFSVISKGQRPKILRVVPHLIDTGLFALGIALIVVTGFMPFTAAAQWLTVKLGLLVLYVLFGTVAIRDGRAFLTRLGAYVVANACVFGMIYLALNKPVFW
ncbi:MAG: SirB2 family protein [Neisseriaceae bacterium]|nr:SirB2 family protein [Neisseriaceae bacterium]MBP6862827.1 SirB2 family protein [Neisseriaceae bacterium]